MVATEAAESPNDKTPVGQFEKFAFNETYERCRLILDDGETS